jgi:exopolysaccharide biosynthesis polyprenyl glycosylphosphotransferase
MNWRDFVTRMYEQILIHRMQNATPHEECCADRLMTFERQDAWIQVPFLSRGEVGRVAAPAAIPIPRPKEGAASADWLNPQWSNGRKNDSNRGRNFQGGRWVQLAYTLIDISCIVANGVLAFSLRFSPGDLHRFFVSGRFAIKVDQVPSPYGAFLFLYVALILLFCQWQSLYRTLRTRSAQEESFAVLKAVSFATLLLTGFIYLAGVKTVSRLVVATCMLINVVSMSMWRYLKRRIVIRRVEQGIGARNVLIIGAGKVGQALARQFDQNKHLGYRFKGFLDGNHSGDCRMLGKIEDLSRIARAEFVDEVFITIPSERELVKRIATEARQHRLDVKVLPDLYDGLGWHAPICHIGDFPIMDLHWQPIPVLGLFAKRIFDVVVSSFSLIICSPVLALLAVWIKLDSPGPVFYRSRRVGKKGYAFTCYKLRTMSANAEEMKNSLRHKNERQGPFFKIKDDPRITRLGKFLRKYSVDELPQLWNVLKGDMSLVGPRPHPVDDFERYSLDHLCRLDVKPGITGLWQVEARRDPSFATNMRHDLEYIQNWNFWLDLKILARTLPVMCQGSGQ